MTLKAPLLRLVENILIAGFVAMIALVFGNVVLRYGFNSGIISSDELSRMIFVWLTFGGAFLVAKDGQHLGMTTVVNMLGHNGKWICRVAVEALSLLCMALLVVGCWHQSVINLQNYQPVTGVPQAVIYIAGLVGGLGIGALNVITLVKLFTGGIPASELVIGAESEELTAFENKQAAEKRP